jgi:Ca2+-transporting ATPase
MLNRTADRNSPALYKFGQEVSSILNQIPTQNWHSLSRQQCQERLNTDPRCGLTAPQVAELHRRFGKNQLDRATRDALYLALLRQFKSVIIAILVLAALISAYMGEEIEAMVIVAIVILNAVIGFFQETKAENAIEALGSMSAPSARVIRDGAQQQISAAELVPGDVIDVEAGDFVPADVRLIESYQLRTQEASLTGESTPVDKSANHDLPADTALAERSNMLYLGTNVLAGKALGIVCATGLGTQLGQIAGMIARQKSDPTPLQRRLSELGQILLVVCLVLVVIIGAIQYTRGSAWHDLLLFSISLAVAAVPEGLAAVVTVALALGLTRMARRNALIRRLPSVETLGSVNVICSDKTGTLTRNEMTVREIYCDGNEYSVSGSGYTPTGDILLKSADGEQPTSDSMSKALALCLEIGATCNHSELIPPEQPHSPWRIIGDPTEAALVVAASKVGIHHPGKKRLFVDQFPFDSTRKMMSVIIQTEAGSKMLFAKGAPESILSNSRFELRSGNLEPLDETRRQQIITYSNEMARRALRVLAVGFLDLKDKTHDSNKPEANICFVGFLGMIDPPRDEVKPAITRCRSAGIKPVMITGDHPATARAIALELGISNEDDAVISGKELDGMTDLELSRQVSNISVYARVSPEHKLRVVKAWQSRGFSCAMTGDGVNDAPAVKAADIGIAMGITGTDVTKEASAMILVDDNFSSIINAVEEGRGILDNIQNILRFLISGNAAELLLVMVALLIGLPVPLLPIQILWINLVTDGFPALALATEKPARDSMQRPPRPTNKSILDWQLGMMAMWQGGLIATVSIFALYLGLNWTDDATDPHSTALGQAAAFAVCATSQLFYSLSCRSQSLSIVKLGWLTNPILILALSVSIAAQSVVMLWGPAQRIFLGHELIMEPEFLLCLLALSIAPASLVEISKLFRQLKLRHLAQPRHDMPRK